MTISRSVCRPIGPTTFKGYHGKHLLIIADEAPGLESGIWDAIAGAMAGGKVHVVMAGNPILPAGAFFDAFGRERDLWNCISVDAFDSPNLAGISLEQLLEMDPSAGGPLDQNPVSYLVTRRWVYDQHKAWWHGDERSSPNWMSRVRGQFPDQAQNALIKLAWLERALERSLANPVEDDAPSLIAGVDVGGGEAETVVYLCASKPGQHKIIKMGAWRAEDTRGEVVRFLAPYRSRLTTVRVDDIGIGRNFGFASARRAIPWSSRSTSASLARVGRNGMRTIRASALPTRRRSSIRPWPTRSSTTRSTASPMMRPSASSPTSCTKSIRTAA